MSGQDRGGGRRGVDLFVVGPSPHENPTSSPSSTKSRTGGYGVPSRTFPGVIAAGRHAGRIIAGGAGSSGFR